MCSAVVPNAKPFSRPFECEKCGAKLQFCKRQNKILAWIPAPPAVAVAWMLRFRGWQLAGASIVLFFVIGFLSYPVIEKIWPARLEPWDGGRAWG